MKNKKFNIIEDMGYGITYVVFKGTLHECQEWINKNTVPHWLNDNIRIIDDAAHRDGNGYPYCYRIEMDEE